MTEAGTLDEVAALRFIVDGGRLLATSDGKSLAEFLSTRRKAVRPEEVGLPVSGRRRVAGLRRDEVAYLAGISVEYYQRLEQGRDRNPSESVIHGIARALRLDRDAARYLRDLATRRDSVRPRCGASEDLHVNPVVQQLIDSWPLTAAQVCRTHTLTVIATNRLAVALSPLFAAGHNSLRELFCEPEMRAFFRNWDELAAATVPYLRSLLGSDRNDPELIELIEDLRSTDAHFRRLWERHEVRRRPQGLMHINHPQVGSLDLHYQQMVLPDTGQLLVPYWADPGSPSEEKMRLLAGM